MPMQLLKLIPLSKNSIIFLLVTINVVAIAYILISRDSLKRSELMYLNPSTTEKVKIKYLKGPVRIVEKIIESPSGDKITERSIVQDSVSIVSESESNKKPIASNSGNRYLIGGSWQVSAVVPQNGTLWAGYSFGRLDVLSGIKVQRDETPSLHLMAVTRWGS